MTDTHNVYDISPEKRKVIEWKNARRLELRREFLKQVGNPERHAEHHIIKIYAESISRGFGNAYEFISAIQIDPAFQRHQVFRMKAHWTFKPTPYNGLLWMGGTFTAIALTAWLLKTTKDAQEKQIRTGQISYRDREFKFHS